MIFHSSYWSSIAMHSLKKVVNFRPISADFATKFRFPHRNGFTRHASTLCKATSVKHDNSTGNIHITWDNHRSSEYPYVFLRDNCPCPTCRHPSSGQRFVLVRDAVKDAKHGIENAELAEDGVNVNWNCGHTSMFQTKWLQERGFLDDFRNQKRGHTVRGFNTVLWDANHGSKMKTVEFDDVMNKDEVLYEWMKAVLTEGIAILKNAPQKPSQLDVLAARACGRVQHTMYGDKFTVRDKPDANNLAYTSGLLVLHTDQPYYNNQPQIQALHCIVPSVEGEGVNHLVDGFKVAYDLKETQPEHFKLLSTLTFPYEQAGNDMYGEFEHYADQSLIGLNEFGEVDRISHNSTARASFMNHTAEEVKKLYEALDHFDSISYEEKYVVNYQLKAGDIICFNNRRVLHGRTPYNPKLTRRWLEGAYFSWDDFCAKVRPLKCKFEP